MDIYILDKNLQNEFSLREVLDVYESLVWTEKFRDVGDFELELDWSVEKQKLLRPGTFLAIPESRRVMMVLSRSSEVDQEGFRKLKVTGESLEHIFKVRHLQLVSDKKPWDAVQVFPKNSYNHTLRWTVQRLINNTSGNQIRNLTYGIPDGYPSYSFKQSPAPITLEQGYVHDVLKSVTAQGDIGYRLIPKHVITRNTPLYFDAYTPRDRTVPNDYVIFGELFENVNNVRTFSSLVGYHNRIWINGYPEATTTFWHEDGALEKDDFARRLGYEGVDIKSIREQDSNTLTSKQISRVKAEEFLAATPPTFTVEGEMDNLTSKYVYDVDYNLGDLVHYVDVCSTKYALRVEAQTFVSDNEGFRTYPTLMQYSKYNMNVT